MIRAHYFLLSLVGLILILIYHPRFSQRFFWKRYLLLLLIIFLGLLSLFSLIGIKAFYIFAVSSFGGLALEWLAGFLYHKIVGSRLWVYERYPLPGRYTSWLTMPIWGFGLTLVRLLFNYI